MLQAPSRHGWLTSDDIGPIGFIDLEILDGEAEITYSVSPSRRRQGLGRTTVAQIITLATNEGARQIHAAVEPTNTPSLAVLRASGFTELGKNEFGELEFRMDLPAWYFDPLLNGARKSPGWRFEVNGRRGGRRCERPT